ncbi:MAG: N-acetylmuramoyl-L-alanine amidase [Candidatus Omnitrophica bacterium]|nr:N-acetylmuramoyl-L-alanine amidase [Candidatus Omnitrophota bacterium]
MKALNPIRNNGYPRYPISNGVNPVRSKTPRATAPPRNLAGTSNGVKLTIAGFFVLVLSSCVIAPMRPVSRPAPPPPSRSLRVPVVVGRTNITHTVAPGESLWRISQVYDVSIDAIVRANKLKHSSEVKLGQNLLIPSALPPQSVITLYPSRKWKYIIIHHSATDEGNSLHFHHAHQRRGFKEIGYHFVIDNGTRGKQNGFIEVSPRWIKQEYGAHCRAGGMNYKSLGICLVGNFSKEEVSEKQLNSLVYLVNLLRDYYHIPLKNIMGHSDAPGAQTECPGTKFPWRRFFRELSEAAAEN